jgi:hypothetical protein
LRRKLDKKITFHFGRFLYIYFVDEEKEEEKGGDGWDIWVCGFEIAMIAREKRWLDGWMEAGQQLFGI